MNETKAKLIEQQEIDRQILGYVRAMQSRAPIVAESVLGFLKTGCRRHVDISTVTDRLAYLASAGYLKDSREFEFGEWLSHYTLTADGADVLDGARPWRYG